MQTERQFVQVLWGFSTVHTADRLCRADTVGMHSEPPTVQPPEPWGPISTFPRADFKSQPVIVQLEPNRHLMERLELLIKTFMSPKTRDGTPDPRKENEQLTV